MSLNTNIPKVTRQLSSHSQHGAAIAYLGQLALSHPLLLDLIVDAGTLISQVLPADITLVWELEPGREHIALRHHSVRKETGVVQTQTPVEADSLEGLVLRSPNSILVNVLDTESRFQPSPLLLEHGAVSGVGIRIGTMEHPLGILEVFLQRLQDFSEDDIHFLQSVANILASAIELKRKQEQWANSEHALRQEVERSRSVTASGQAEWERYEIKSRLVESRERERLQLAQELHDIPIQDLYGLMYQLDDLKSSIKDADGLNTVEEFSYILHRVVNSLRSICGELRPPSLSPFGLEVAIRDHVEKIRGQNPDILIYLDLMRDQQVLSDGLRLSLFRVYQQAINNILRHAQATEIQIRFQYDDRVIILEVEDNGKGFRMPRDWIDLVREEHFGLVGLAERVESVHGKLEIISSIGDGTMIRVIVPRR